MNEKNDELLRKNLGISITDLNQEKLTSLIVDAYLYHEGMTQLSLEAINKKDALGNQPHNNEMLWDSFETNNTLSFSMRELLLKASEAPEL